MKTEKKRSDKYRAVRRGILALPLLVSLMAAGCSSLTEAGRDPARSDLFAMDTYMTFTAYGDGAEQALEKVSEQIKKAESEWSVTDGNSEIYRVNHSAGKTVTLGEETSGIVSFALEMARETEGALDPTIYPVLTAWGFTTDENRIPSQEEIDGLLQHVGYEKVEMTGNQITLPEGMELDLGAVGKGYAGDLSAEILKESGITSALLDIGGNIQAIGSRPGGGEWRLGLQNPFGDGEIGLLTVSDCAVVTSGNYERYFIGEDGKRYCHIIDPETGYPVDNNVASVTVITEEGKRADALSTALFVMGEEKAEDYWKQNPGFGMIILTEDGRAVITEEIEECFTLDSQFADIKVSIISR